MVFPALRVRLGSDVPERFRPRIAYALAETSVRLGRRLVLVPETISEGADIAMGKSTATLKLPFHLSAWDGTGSFVATGEKKRLWAHQECSDADVDLLGGIFRLLTLADERDVPNAERDERGIFLTSALPAARRSVLAVPLVEWHVEELAKRLAAVGLGPVENGHVRPWPQGRNIAMCLTHDTDNVDFGAPLEIGLNAAKWVIRRDPVFLKLVRDGLRIRMHSAYNPYFAFHAWQDFGRSRGISHAFYLFHRIAVKRRLNDCRATVFNRPIDWNFLRELAREGHEFGVHPAIEAKDSLDELIAVKSAVEDRIGKPVFGLRHHYWAIDWRKPHLTWRRHVNAGYRYDLSIAWRDASGFRAGTCLPYHPWDPDRDRPLDLYIVPTAVMDGHVLGRSTGDSPLEAALPVFRAVSAVGGLLVTDWHTEAGCNDYLYLGYRSTLEAIVDRLSKDDHVWFATPWQVVQKWHGWFRQVAQGSVHG